MLAIAIIFTFPCPEKNPAKAFPIQKNVPKKTKIEKYSPCICASEDEKKIHFGATIAIDIKNGAIIRDSHIICQTGAPRSFFLF